MNRRLVNLAAIVSLVLCIATIAVGVASRWRRLGVAYSSYEYVDRRDWQRTISTSAVEGRLSVGRGRMKSGYNLGSGGPLMTPGWQAWCQPLDRSLAVPTRWHGFGFESVDRVFETYAITSWRIIVPDWFIALMLAILPAARVWRWWRRRVPPGHCRQCGYDLRATPERCPECGTASATLH